MKKIVIILALFVLNLYALAVDTLSTTQDTNVSVIDESHKVFGYTLFNGSFSNAKQHRYNPNYLINIGDIINIKLWGAFDFNASIPVDSQGNIFLPKVGTIKLLGVRNDKLSLAIQNELKSVFRENVHVYADLGNYQPVSIFVTGAVNKPGLYEGLSSDSIIQFLDKAKGIDSKYGSYRKVSVLRENKLIKEFDLYTFLLSGELDLFQFQMGDVINVGSITHYIEINGDVKRAYRYEIKEEFVTLDEITKVAILNPTATSFTIKKWNQENEQTTSIHSIKDNRNMKIYSGEVIEFLPDHNAKTIEIKVTGEHLNLRNLVVKKGATLKDVFEKINPSELSNLNAFQLYRQSVAQQQKVLLESQLKDLEAKTLTTGSMTNEEAIIRKQEAQLVLNFIDRAKKVEPKGQVVINKATDLSNIILEDKDEIYIPMKNHMVIVQGEVMLPSAQSFVKEMSFEDYIKSCGGYNFRADENNVLIIKQNGKVLSYNPSSWTDEKYSVEPGDNILVLGKVETKSLQVVKDITQILYQIAVGAAVVLRY
ncbi:MAG: polysaccharide biosynthesis/export family protein [Sulfurimonas sp.]|nr:polysaccharide biosynthesis/export family protein [Sulfurimonas sp.]